MKISLQDITATRQQIAVEVSAEEIAALEKDILRVVSKQAKIPGFRPGKAPENMIRSRYADYINEELQRKVSGAAYQEAVKEKDIDVFTVVSVEGTDDIRSGMGAHLSITVDVMPQFELPTYEGIPTQVPPIDVTDEEIEKEIDRQRNERASYNPVEREAAEGDYVRVAYTGKIDGTPIGELVPEDAPQRAIISEQKSTWELAGDVENGLEAVARGIIGMQAGDKKEAVSMTFPATFPVEQIAGREAHYDLEVFEVREKVLPELNEEFLKSVQMESVDQLRERVSENIAQYKVGEKRRAQRRQVIDRMLSTATFTLPETAIEAETDQAMRELMEANLQRGVKEEALEAEKEKIYDTAREAAEQRVRLRFILAKIAEKEKVAVAEEDFQRWIMGQAMQNRQKPDEIVNQLQNNRDYLDSVRRELLQAKTLDLVIDRAVEEPMEAAEPVQS